MTTPTEISGRFGGYVFTDAGKRRMRLLLDGCELLLKVPRFLRRRIIGKFRESEPIRVAITEEEDPATGTLKQIVQHILPATVEFVSDAFPPAASRSETSCVVRVCSKKNCWRHGGRELWQALEHEARASGGHVEVRQVGCLDRCKQRPNVDCGDRTYAHCSPRDAGPIIAHAGRSAPRSGSEKIVTAA